MDLTNVVELAKGSRLAVTGLSRESQRLVLNAIAPPKPAEKPSAAPSTSPPQNWPWVVLLSILGGLFFLFKLFEVGVLTFRRVSLSDDFEF
ncbi:MAG: uncharacterized protein KVP18_001924 [Porospora cf. gigantea A]|nr:MAG: hypothetical protein KVP18_001924 [Porospora cf. gigantea A]